MDSVEAGARRQHGVVWLPHKALLVVRLQHKHLAQEVVHDLQAHTHRSVDPADTYMRLMQLEADVHFTQHFAASLMLA